MWLRPGKKYLFGRTYQDGVRHAVQHSSISRKHMIIEVSPVKPDDCRHIHTKSELRVTDLDSKCGTVVDGERIHGDSRTLGGEQHTLMLGRFAKPLRINWHSVVLSFSFTGKELKAGDPLANVSSRLGDFDIKTVIPYIVDKTTHVVQKKRNTAKGLQALINGKYIVQDSYLDALVYAATPSDLENMESLSPLETDFDSAWPDPTDYLPPPGREPIPRPAEAFSPNPDRINVFEGYTFVFGDASQYETLRDPINNGHGKALLYEIERGVTTAEDIVQFMRNAAGQKGVGGERDEQGGVVLVRFRARGSWEIDLADGVAQITDQRVIEQSEFLDAILENDASPLCRPLPRPEPSQVSESVPALEPMRLTNQDSQQSRSLLHLAEPSEPEPAQLEPSQPKSSQQEPSQLAQTHSRRPKARNFVSKVQAFDDGFDFDSIPLHPVETGHNSQYQPGPMEIEPALEHHTQSAPETRIAEEEDVVSDLLPGANAMKRRRAEMGQHRRGDSQVQPEPEEPPKPKRQKLDLIEEARKHRDENEEAQQQRRQEEESALQATLKDMSIDEMKALAVVEEIEVPVRGPRPRMVEDEGRWDERWNGRKNFKKFRRKGESHLPHRRMQAVIVPLEEVGRKDFGVGERYWVGNKTSQNDSLRESQRESLNSPEDAGLDPGMASSSQRLAPTESMLEASQATSVSRRAKRLREVRDSDSDDELRFRFRFRRRR